MRAMHLLLVLVVFSCAVDEGGFWGKPTQIAFRTATLMKNQKVLVAGGEPAYYDTADFPLSRAELYDPVGTFTATSSMHVARTGHRAAGSCQNNPNQ